mmetsp:Transcript_27884/g.50505  ORF Transcript_27884/g.50505 Transcript_27884/m.50505 type:complete len:351 (+) Transcript_27884:833-1885(+)
MSASEGCGKLSAFETPDALLHRSRMRYARSDQTWQTKAMLTRSASSEWRKDSRRSRSSAAPRVTMCLAEHSCISGASSSFNSKRVVSFHCFPPRLHDSNAIRSASSVVSTERSPLETNASNAVINGSRMSTFPPSWSTCQSKVGAASAHRCTTFRLTNIEALTGFRPTQVSRNISAFWASSSYDSSSMSSTNSFKKCSSRFRIDSSPTFVAKSSNVSHRNIPAASASPSDSLSRTKIPLDNSSKSHSAAMTSRRIVSHIDFCLNGDVIDNRHSRSKVKSSSTRFLRPFLAEREEVSITIHRRRSFIKNSSSDASAKIYGAEQYLIEAIMRSKACESGVVSDFPWYVESVA